MSASTRLARQKDRFAVLYLADNLACVAMECRIVQWNALTDARVWKF